MIDQHIKTVREAIEIMARRCPATKAQALTALAAIEQAMREPVGYVHPQALERILSGETVAFRKKPYTEPSHGVYLAPPAQQPQAEAVQACGHPMSLLLRSAESNEPLYCEACDDKSGRHDAERRETELLDANRRLQEKIGSADALKLHAIEELCQLGYTVKDGELFPPDHLHKLMEAANHPLCGKQTEAVPSSALNPDESDSVTLWAEIWRLREAVKGPDGYATWQDAATAERIRRVRAESKQAEASALIERMADALRSCSGVPHWPSFQPLINEASKWKVEAVPPTHVLVPVEPTPEMEMAWDDANGDGAPFHAMYATLLAAAPQQKGGGHVG